MSIMMTALEFYHSEVGIPLLDWFEVVFWDDSGGGRKAHHIVWGGKALYRRDLPHQTHWLKNR